MELGARIAITFNMTYLLILGMCEMLESRGIVTYKSKKGISPRLAKVSLRLDEGEVTQAMQDKNMLATIMDDKSLLY